MTGTAAELPVVQRLGVDDDARLRELADAPVFTVFQQLAGSPRGLTER